jgi:hypothetical protein
MTADRWRCGVLERGSETPVTVGVVDLVHGLGEKRAVALEEFVETIGSVEQ